MKIVAIVDSQIGIGGGFDQSLNAVLQMQQICEGRFDLEVFSTHQENIPYLATLGIKGTHYRYSMLDRMISKLQGVRWWQYVQKQCKYLTLFERKLIATDCDLVYFVAPGRMAGSLQKLNYIATVWDICHRDNPEFPEVRDFYRFHDKERLYKRHLAPAVLILTDSDELADRASHYYGIARSRFLAMPFAPSPFLKHSNVSSKNSVLAKYKLEEGYFYYPAQFWAHKNHIRLLQALVYLRDRQSWQPKVVLSGKDHGNLTHVEKFVADNNLAEQVKLLGFVDSEDLRGLYEGALAIVMPTYFGPTNLPPLEAWTIGKPLIYSSHLASHAGNAAVLVDPDNAEDLAMAMHGCRDKQRMAQLVDEGHNRIAEINHRRASAEQELGQALEKFAQRRACWE
ncbi:MAG: glycosyltransferase family 4 protein [Gammaproteobacteria bacterium]|nr:glycosyltransferase family 4 protein [Gammaproteobacteria bacterium]